MLSICFFFNDTATTEIYTLSLHDALPIYMRGTSAQLLLVVGAVTAAIGFPRMVGKAFGADWPRPANTTKSSRWRTDRKSTRLNSSHQIISYAVFCFKKKKT